MSCFLNRLVRVSSIFIFILLLIPALSSAQTILTNCSELQNISWNLSGNYRLGNNIDCSMSKSWPAGGFSPIGTAATPFTGQLDGKGFSVTNLYSHSNNNEAGLLGHTLNATITNLNLNNVDVQGKNYVGGLVGFAENTTISQVNIDGYVSQTPATDMPSVVGGLVGHSQGSTVSRSSSYVSVSGSLFTGGLVGENMGNISESFANGYAEGGINWNDLNDIYEPNVNWTDTGGLNWTDTSGLNWTDTSSLNWTDMSALNWDDVSAVVGGIAGRTKNGTVEKSYSLVQVAMRKMSDNLKYLAGFMGSIKNTTLGQSLSAGFINVNNNTKAINKDAFCGEYINSSRTQKSATDPSSAAWWNSTCSGNVISVGTSYNPSFAKSTYQNESWDFTNTWDICEGQDYPKLKSEGGQDCQPNLINQFFPLDFTNPSSQYWGMVADGNYAAVHEDAISGVNNMGAVYIYQKQGSQWIKQVKLAPASEIGTNFGMMMSLSGDTLTLATSKKIPSRVIIMHVFKLSNGDWVQTQRNEIPTTYALEAGQVSKNMFVALTPYLPTFGANPGAKIYVNDGTNWSFLQELLPDEDPGYVFMSVAIDQDNSTIALTASKGDRNTATNVYVFKKVGTTYTKIARIPGTSNEFGVMKMALNGKVLVVPETRGDLFLPIGYVYDFSQTDTAQKQTLFDKNPFFKYYHGYAADIRGDTLVISVQPSPYTSGKKESLYVYKKNASGVWKHVYQLAAADFGTWVYSTTGGGITINGGRKIAQAQILPNEFLIGTNSGLYSFAPQPPPTVSFSLASSGGSEATGVVNVALTLDRAINKTVSVNVKVLPTSTATQGSDYTLPASLTVTFAPLQTTQNFTINIVKDSVTEPSESLILEIYSPVNANLGATTQHNLLIADSGCFIATAAYGSPLEPQVQALRDFRDTSLLKNEAGEEFVDWYYQTSPSIANKLSQHNGLRKAVRGALTPVVKFTQWYQSK
jgi:hypothetical protein